MSPLLVGRAVPRIFVLDWSGRDAGRILRYSAMPATSCCTPFHRTVTPSSPACFWPWNPLNWPIQRTACRLLGARSPMADQRSRQRGRGPRRPPRWRSLN